MTVPTKTMAVRLFEYGGPEKLIYAAYDLPPLGAHDILIKNFAGSVSRWDVKYRAGDLTRYQIPGRAAFPLPQQLGREAAGEVVAVGSAVSRFKPGDRVVGVTHPEDPNSIETARGLGNLSRNLAIPGHQAFGSYAQYLVRDEQMWLRLPDGVDYEQAGVALWPFSSSHRVVHDRLQVRLGDTVLITGASGGMGQATMQLCKLAGARVIATTRHANKAAVLRELGADAAVITTDAESARAEVLSLTGGEGVDHAVDYTGSPDLLRFIGSLMRLGGSIVVTSEQGREPVPFLASDLIRLELNLLGIRGARMNDMVTVLRLLGEHRVNTRIAARFPLAKVGEAHELLVNSPDLVGRIVVLPWLT
ncbi:MAG: zinc-binding alcohol dehydrogenase family protein [Xanthobacteraceae bacterium]|jgi:putative oxidoreductase